MLSKIDCPDDIKCLTYEELDELAVEIRRFLIEKLGMPPLQNMCKTIARLISLWAAFRGYTAAALYRMKLQAAALAP